MNTNLKELLDSTITKEEYEGLDKMIEMMLHLRCQIRIRESYLKEVGKKW